MFAKPVIATACLLGSLALAQVPNPTTAQPDPAPDEARIFAENRTVHLGRIKQGAKGTALFTIENRGNVDLHITGVRASCGCTVPRKLTEEEKTLAPGASLEIEAVFDTKGRTGKQRKNITVTSDDPFEPKLQLFLTAEVVTLMEITVKNRVAKSLPLGSVRPGTTIENTIDVLPTEPGQSLVVDSIEIRDEALTYTLEPLVTDDRTGTRITLSVEPDARLGRRIITSMEISATVGDEKTSAALRLNGEIVGELQFRPWRIDQLSPVRAGSELRPVSITSQVRQPFEILGIDAGEILEASVADQDNQFGYMIKLRIKDSAPPGPFGTFVDIRTSSVVQPLIRIPVFAHVRPRIEVGPPRVLVRRNGNEKMASKTVKLENSSGGRLELGEITTSLPYVDARLVEIPGRPRKAVKHVRIVASEDAPVGTHEVVVTVSTTVPDQLQVTIPVTLIVQ